MPDHNNSMLPIKPCDPFTPKLPTVGPSECQSQTTASEGPNSFPPVPPPATSLDTQESSVKNFLAEASNASELPAWETLLKLQVGEATAAEKFRHSGWWPIRKRVIASMYRTRQSDSRIRAICTCGRTAWVQRADLDMERFRIVQNNCHDRLCTPCAISRSHRIREALLSQIDNRPVKFVTLTLCGKGESLTELLDRLYKSFRALRQHPTWSERVTGGAACLEIKWSEKAKRWHPHLHIVMESKFVPQWELSDAWRSITQDSFVVDIRPVRQPEIALAYVTKYASKALDTSFALSPERLDEAMVALKGRRLCLCFGTWYGTPLSLAEDAELADDEVDAGGWTNFMGLEQVMEQADQGDAYCRHILTLMRVDARWIKSRELDTS